MRKRIATVITLYAIIMHAAFATDRDLTFFKEINQATEDQGLTRTDRDLTYFKEINQATQDPGLNSDPINGASNTEFDVSDYNATVNVSTGSKLNVRKGPGTTHAIIGARYRGDTVRVTHHDGVWRRIAWSAGQIAYVHGNYLQNVDSDTKSDPTGDPRLKAGNPELTAEPSPVPLNSSASISALSDSELQQRIDNWQGTDNDPILDRLVSERNARLDIARGTQVDLAELQELEQQKPGAAEQYLSCMVGKFNSKLGAATKAWTIFKNGVKLGVKKIVTSPMLAVNHMVCLVAAHDWADPPKPFSPQAESCTPAMGALTGCRELDSFYGTPEGIKIWESFQFTAACDKECKLTCYFHGKNKRTYEAFINDPHSVRLMCRYR